MGIQVVSIMDHGVPLIQLEAHQKAIVYHPFLHSTQVLEQFNLSLFDDDILIC